MVLKALSEDCVGSSLLFSLKLLASLLPLLFTPMSITLVNVPACLTCFFPSVCFRTPVNVTAKRVDHHANTIYDEFCVGRRALDL
jgi:hypothetical protein